MRSLSAMLFAAALLLPAVASAEQPPAKVPVQAYLTDGDGMPIDSDSDLTVVVELFDGEEASGPLHSETFQVQPTAGSFTVYLGANTSLDLSLFRDEPTLWAEVTVEGQILEPRIEIATAPYAASAGYAEHAASADSADNADSADSADNAENLGGNPPEDYTYTDGTGLSKNGQEFSVKQATIEGWIDGYLGDCGSGEVAVGRNSDGSLMCNSVDTAHLADDAVTNDKITDGAVDRDKIGSGEVTGSELADGAVERNHITQGEVIHSKLADNAVESEELADGEVVHSKLADDAVASEEIVDGEVEHAKLANQAVEEDNIASDAVTNSEISDDTIETGNIRSRGVKRGDLEPYECEDTGGNPGDTVLLAPEGGTTGPGCPLDNAGRAGFLPRCDEAPVGSLCRYTGNCDNARTPTEMGDCNGTDVVFKGEE